MDGLQSEGPWWRTAFDLDWARMLSHMARDAPREARAIHKMLHLPLGSKILDLCCGDGRISVHLARLGYDMTGLDFSSPLLRAAQRRSLRAALSIRWVERDMKEIGFSTEFDAIISISTSFGYFENEKDNLTVLQSAANALKRGGKLLLDLENVFYLSHLARLYGNTPTYHPVDRFRGWVEEATSFDPICHTVETSLRLWRKEKLATEVRARYRVYSLPEIRCLLESSGLDIQHIYGDFRLQLYNVDSPRMIVLSEKLR